MTELDNSEENTRRFIDSLESIKRAYEKKYKRNFSGFGDAWRHAKDKGDSVATRNSDFGNLLRELRNVIQHASYRNGEPISTPRKDVVELAERLAEQVRKDPEIKEFINSEPITISFDTRLPEIARIVSENDFSQIPITNEGKVKGLLTTNAIARWLAKNINPKDGTLVVEADSVTASDLLEFSESIDSPIYVKPTERAYKVCQRLAGEKPVPAALVTSTGDHNAKLVGIITRIDVAGILKKIEIKRP